MSTTYGEEEERVMDPEPSMLAAVARQHLWAEKWLIAPSRRIGHQWVDRVVRGETDVLNLRVTTPLGLALELAGPSLVADGVTLATERIGTLLVTAVWDAVADGDYMGRLEPTGSIAKLVWSSLNELRLADVESGSLDEERLGHGAKAADLRGLLDAYVARLGEERLVDDADVYRRALDRVRTEAAAPDVLYLVPRSLRAAGGQREFLEGLPSAQRLAIEVAPRSSRDVGLLSRREGGMPTNASPRNEDSVGFSRAIGEVNEVRSVLRRCLAEAAPLDDVEVLVSDVTTYVPLIREIGRSLVAPDRPDGLPITIADGIPAATSRPGRALTAWLGWIATDHPQAMLVRMIGDGLLDLDREKSKIGSGYLAELLRPLAIGFGRDRYTPKLDEQIAAVTGEIRELAQSKEADDVRLERRRRHVDGLKVLKKVIGGLVAVSEGLGRSPADALDAAAAFLGEHAACVGEFDEFSRVALGDAVRESRVWVDRLGTALDVPTWLATLPDSVSVLGSGPRPGHLHVSSLNSGGHAGRTTTFVLGLDDGRFPGAHLQDPILLDAERRVLSDELPTSSDRLEERLSDLAERLARLPGRLVLSWSCHDVPGGSETFPSPFVLSVFRLVSGRTGADMADLDAAAGPPVSFAPAGDAPALTESELWLAQFSSRRIARGDRWKSVRLRYPHLARGERAAAQRLGGSVNEFNGLVPEAGGDLDPFAADGVVLSASALQTAGRCPLSYFFARGLGLFALDEQELDPDRWLDPATYGSLLHEVFRMFMVELAADDRRPDFERDNLRLAAILTGAIDHQRRETPPPNETAFRTQCWELAQVARVFLDREEEHCRTNRPRYFELAIGTDPVGEGTELDSPEPVTITLPSGRTLHTKGQIDRVDELDGTTDEGDSPRYGVWDYKSGSAWGYDRADPFAEGRRIQNVLYRLIVDDVLARSGGGRVAESGYFFPGTRARGLRVSWSAEELDAGTAVLDALGRSIAAGVFVPTSNDGDCRFCDHQSICGNVQAVAAHSKRLLNDPAVTEIADFRELRLHD